jgi:tRNA dimethylallyltransferase
MLPPLVVITGPTAVGKTALALEVAETIHGEIIGADSRQVYRLIDIGTAKPTLDERARIPHHLIDVVYPDEQLSLAQVQRLAHIAINDIHHGKRQRHRERSVAISQSVHATPLCPSNSVTTAPSISVLTLT